MNLGENLKGIEGLDGRFMFLKNRLEGFVGKQVSSCNSVDSAWEISQLRRLWYEGQYIPGITQDNIPDLNSCLLYQQLQVINCCISRKRRHSAAVESLESVEASLNVAASIFPVTLIFMLELSLENVCFD